MSPFKLVLIRMSKRIKFEVAPEFVGLSLWIKQLQANFAGSGETIFKSRNEVKVFKVGDYELNVKAFRIPNLVNRIVYVYFRNSKAARSFKNARKFFSLDIPTPAAIGFIDVIDNGLLSNSYYISLHHNYNFTLREAMKFDAGLRDEILRQWVRFTYLKLHKNGIYHLDYSPGNTLITETEGIYQFNIVDLNRLQFGSIGFEKGLGNFCRLEADNNTLSVIGQEYALLRGVEPEKGASALVRIEREHDLNTKRVERRKLWFKNLIKRSENRL